MKRILVLISAVILAACTPEDNKLNTSNVKTSSQSGGKPSPQNGLKVGSYGLPIFAAQNFEQVGALVSQCLASEDPTSTVTENGQELQVKNCFIKVGREMTDEDKKNSPIFSEEKWYITLYQNPGSGVIVKSTGHLMNGSDSSLFKGKPVTLTYKSKGFIYQAESNKVQIVIAASGDMGTGSNPSELDFAYRLDGQARMAQEDQNRVWNFDSVTYFMNLPARNISFDSSSKNLKLIWASSQCANFSGDAQTKTSTDKAAANINLVQGKATLQGGTRNWQQEYKSCDNRTEPVRNFEFLFF